MGPLQHVRHIHGPHHAAKSTGAGTIRIMLSVEAYAAENYVSVHEARAQLGQYQPNDILVAVSSCSVDASPPKISGWYVRSHGSGRCVVIPTGYVPPPPSRSVHWHYSAGLSYMDGTATFDAETKTGLYTYWFSDLLSLTCKNGMYYSSAAVYLTVDPPYYVSNSNPVDFEVTKRSIEDC